MTRVPAHDEPSPQGELSSRPRSDPSVPHRGLGSTSAFPSDTAGKPSRQAPAALELRARRKTRAARARAVELDDVFSQFTVIDNYKISAIQPARRGLPHVQQ